MKDWQKVSALLCVFGFLREIRPSEPYVTEFLYGGWHNVTEDEVNRQVYPVGTYSYLAQLVIVFLITDFFRYKPIIITMGCCGIIVWSLLLWTKSLVALQIMEFFYGTYLATEIAYFTYIYAKVDKRHYPRVTSNTRAAFLMGRFVAGLSAQLLLNYKIMDYRQLNYITLGAQICCTIWAFALPNVRNSLYFNRADNSEESIQTESCNDFNKGELTISGKAFLLLWSHFKNAYSNLNVLQSSIWYALGLCGQLQVATYIQVLWKTIEPNPTILWNGAVEATLTLFGAVLAIAAGYIHAGRLSPRGSLLVSATLAIMEGGSILLACWATNLYVSYIGYIMFGSFFAFAITVTSAEVARYLEEDSFGLVFGINTLLALVIQTILTVVVVADSGLGLSVISQYVVYAFYFIIIGIIYFILVLIEYFYFDSSKNN